jgi:hypothetical protein
LVEAYPDYTIPIGEPAGERSPVNERLVRFDVRYLRNDYVDAFWDDAHRNSFLLQPETEWPLSVDPLAWLHIRQVPT